MKGSWGGAGGKRGKVFLSTTRVVLHAALRAFSENRGLESAATLSFYGFLALMPLLLLSVFALSLIMRSSETALASLRTVAQGLFPSFSETLLRDLLALSRERAWGWASILLLVWSTTPFTGAVRSCLGRSFRLKPRRSLWLAKVADLAAGLALLGLLVFLVSGRALAEALRASGPALLSPLVSGGLALVGFLAPPAVLLLFYRVFSGVRLRWGQLLAGTLAALLLLSLVRPLFGLVLRFNPEYGYVFGSLKAVFLLVVWAYYTFAVLLFGGEVMAALQRKNALLLRGVFSAKPEQWHVPRILLEKFIRHAGGGDHLFYEGDEGREMYYVVSGEVSLQKEGRELRRMGPGDYFGEMSMILELPRTAAACVVSAHATFLSIARENFDLILRENPEIVRRILREMALRLKDTSEQMVEDDPLRPEA